MIHAKHMIKTYTFHDDPGHGWIEVPIADVKLSGAKISDYSYRNGSLAYLEEDCDAPHFIQLMKLKGFEIKFMDKTYNNECFIRRLHRYN